MKNIKYLFLVIIVFTSIRGYSQEIAQPDIYELDTIDYVGEYEIDSTQFSTNDTSANQFIGNIPCHQLYNIWMTTLINPYNVDVTKITDTINLDCSNFYPPLKYSIINSDFGWRRWKFHYGIDLDLVTGDTIYAAFDGMVRMATRGKRFGYYVVLRHYNKLETVYGHLSKLLVSPNLPVKAGDPIALGGSTGRSTGPHLHMEFRYLGQPINPHDIARFDTLKMKYEVLPLCKSNFEYLEEIRKIRFYTVRKGDTLGGIAIRHGISITQLCQLNKIRKTSILRIGQKIRYT